MSHLADEKKWVLDALREDSARKDRTTCWFIPAHEHSEATITFKENGVVCGLNLAKTVFRQLDRSIQMQTRFKDGNFIKKNTPILQLKGHSRAILSGERTALNFLGYLSGIATITAEFVKKTRPYGVKILDTRKTTPCLRKWEKYAVRCGGGDNHRFDLEGAIFIKDNHRVVLNNQRTSLHDQIKRLRRKTKQCMILEVDHLSQFREALRSGVDVILLDNMKPSQLKKAVTLAKRVIPSKRPMLEASGGITLKNIVGIARSGINRISVGYVTHSHRFIDVSLEMKPPTE